MAGSKSSLTSCVALYSGFCLQEEEEEEEEEEDRFPENQEETPPDPWQILTWKLKVENHSPA